MVRYMVSTSRVLLYNTPGTNPHLHVHAWTQSLYHALGSDTRSSVASALELLTALAQLGPGTARELAAALDFSLPAFSSIARPPRVVKSGDAEEGAAAAPTRGPGYWKEWKAESLSSRPTRALFLDFGET